MTQSNLPDREDARLAESKGAPQGKMEALRQGIDSVDEEIVRLLDRRAWLARRIGEIKHKNGLAAYAPARDRAFLDVVAPLGDGDSPSRDSRLFSARSSHPPSRSKPA